jgi:heavy metal translocating P-type ATPase
MLGLDHDPMAHANTAGNAPGEQPTSVLQGGAPNVATPDAPPAQPWLVQLLIGVRRYPLPVLALALLLVSLVLHLMGHSALANVALVVIIVTGGVPLLWETLRQLLHREVGVDLIAILAITGSLALGEYLAGAFIVLMLSGGEALEAFALRRARTSLTALAERAPRTAHLWHDGQLLDVPADQVERGMVVVVKPGEMAPVDGIVLSGDSSVSEADLTGEPLPVRKEAGALVLSGSLNLDSPLQVRATRRSAESQYAQILRLVQAAQEQKAPIHRLADRYGAGFTLLAVGMAALAWIISRDSIYALAVLVVATPCPLILATPIAIMSGIDLAAHKGIIAKSGGTIEQLGEVDVAVFDKTGTLTLGRPEVVDVVVLRNQPTGGPVADAESLVRLAAAVEQFSPHILARAVVEAARQSHTPLALATDVQEIAGKGIRGRVAPSDTPGNLPSDCATLEVAIGNRTYMQALEIDVPTELLTERELRTSQGQIGSFVALDDRIMGLLVFADVPRPELAELAPRLKATGIEEVVLLTGDGESVAQRIGRLAGADRVLAQCLPEQKVAVVRDLEGRHHRVLMVGDGVNDAPALATATVGMAMGAQGLTAASAAADAVLLSPNILQVSEAVRLGRHVMQVARQGIWIGMGLSLVAMVFAALGSIPPAAGAILQEGVDVLVILNALRAGRLR